MKLLHPQTGPFSKNNFKSCRQGSFFIDISLGWVLLSSRNKEEVSLHEPQVVITNNKDL